MSPSANGPGGAPAERPSTVPGSAPEASSSPRPVPAPSETSSPGPLPAASETPGPWPGTALTPDPALARREREEAPWAPKVPEYLRLLSDARTLLLMKFHFFGRLAMRMKFELTERVDTAAIRADARCFFNPHFLEALDIQERAFVIAHELCHLMYGHFPRAHSKIWPLWNVAGDLQINAALKRAGLPLPSRAGLRPLYDPRWEHWSDDQIYWHLEGLPVKRVFAKLGATWWTDQGTGISTPGGDCDFGATETLRRLAREGAGDPVMTVREWWDAVLDAWSAAKGRGQAPGCLERWVEEIRSPQLPWARILARMVSHVLAPGSSWRRQSRRSPSVRGRVMARSGIPTALPGPQRDRDPVVIALDTSGSMSREELEGALGEAAGVLAQYRTPIRVLCCDAAVHLDESYRNALEIKPTGGGGSSTEPVFQRLEEEPGNWGRPRLLIYFTDLAVTFPEAPPPYPVVWVNTAPGEDADPALAPFGTVISLPPRRGGADGGREGEGPGRRRRQGGPDSVAGARRP